jgi:hypothetical protein
MNKKLAFTAIIFIICISSLALADTNKLTNNSTKNETNQTLLNGTGYPSENIVALTLPLLINTNPGFTDSGKFGTDFSISSVSSSGDDQSPAATLTFSDKSSVSGNITKFLKSFTYVSGISV